MCRLNRTSCSFLTSFIWILYSHTHPPGQTQEPQRRGSGTAGWRCRPQSYKVYRPGRISRPRPGKEWEAAAAAPDWTEDPWPAGRPIPSSTILDCRQEQHDNQNICLHQQTVCIWHDVAAFVPVELVQMLRISKILKTFFHFTDRSEKSNDVTENTTWGNAMLRNSFQKKAVGGAAKI